MLLAPSGIASHNVFLQMFSCQNMILGGVHPEELSQLKSAVAKKTYSKSRDEGCTTSRVHSTRIRLLERSARWQGTSSCFLRILS